MGQPHDRPATLAALAAGIVVLSLPAATAFLVWLLAPSVSNSSTTVVGVDPDRERAASQLLPLVSGYLTAVSPFAMVASWRTFVHAKRWLSDGATGGRAILEGAVCGFAGAVLVLLPAIVTRPREAPPYVLAYGGLAAVLGLVVAAIVWVTAACVLTALPRPDQASTPYRSRRIRT